LFFGSCRHWLLSLLFLRGALRPPPPITSQVDVIWFQLALWREKGSPDFGTREVAFVRRVAPHVAAGLRAATLLYELRDDQVNDDAAGVLILDGSGMVMQTTWRLNDD